jgi:RNA polymerase sigma-70 factor (ECF subfamily)
MAVTAAVAIESSEQLTDEEVVQRVVAGDTALFEILIRRHNQRIYRAVRAILRGDEGAEDVMQQAYVKAFAHLRAFERRSAFSTWLTRIAINEALHYARKSGRFAVHEEMPIMEVATREPDPERRAVTAELRGLMEDEVAALGPAYRAVFVMREVENLSTAETAACLGLTEDVVKTRLHRARTTLRERLYERAGITFDSLFAFGNARCDSVVAAVMARIRS